MPGPQLSWVYSSLTPATATPKATVNLDPVWRTLNLNEESARSGDPEMQTCLVPAPHPITQPPSGILSRMAFAVLGLTGGLRRPRGQSWLRVSLRTSPSSGDTPLTAFLLGSVCNTRHFQADHRLLKGPTPTRAKPGQGNWLEARLQGSVPGKEDSLSLGGRRQGSREPPHLGTGSLGLLQAA